MKKIFVILLSLVMMTVGCLSLVACKKEEPLPWWEDHDNIKLVFEDDRSIEKSVTQRYDYVANSMTYIHDEKFKEQYIPQVKIYHKDILQDTYTLITSRRRYDDYSGEYRNCGFIANVGKYIAGINIYLNEDDANNFANEINGTAIYITVLKGEE